MSRRSGLFAAYQHRRARHLAATGRWAEAHHWFARAARRGHADAQFALARDYDVGRGCGRSGSEALRWYRAAAEHDHVDAQFEYGMVLLGGRDMTWCAGSSARWVERARIIERETLSVVFPQGDCVGKDEAEALTWLRLAAQAGKPEAQANLGWLLLKGIGCEPNRAQARRWLTLAAERDIGQAALGLAEFFGAVNEPDSDAEAARAWLRRSADLGNASAAYTLGVKLHGEATEDEAEHYLAFAADKNHVAACRDLGRILLARGPNEAAQRGAEYLRRAAKGGDAEAAAELGEIFSRGERVKPDLREAARWLRQAADVGSTTAQFQVGCFFARGEGVPKDLQRAAHYFRLSAESGHLLGAFNLGVFYEVGEGVARDLDAAEIWLAVAARGGVSQAQVRLAHLKASGRLGAPDRAAAVALLEQAVERKHPDAALGLAKLLLADRDDVETRKRSDELLESAIARGSVPAAEMVVNYSGSSAFAQRTVAAAISCLEQASQIGSNPARIALARLMLQGLHGEPQPASAEQLLVHAAREDSAIAHFELGVLYCQRSSSSDDLARGFNHYRRSAELGYSLGQFNTAVMLLNGTGTDIDVEEATDWLRMASEAGVKQANQILNTLSGVDPV